MTTFRAGQGTPLGFNGAWIDVERRELRSFLHRYAAVAILPAAPRTFASRLNRGLFGVNACSRLSYRAQSLRPNVLISAFIHAGERMARIAGKSDGFTPGTAVFSCDRRV